MTFTREVEKLVSLGNVQGKSCDLNISAYTTGGETIDAAGLGIGHDPTMVEIVVLGTTLRHFAWDRANKKLKVFDLDGVEIVNGTNLGACVRLRATY